MIELTTSFGMAFDALLLLLLVALAFTSLTTKTLFTGVVLFMCYGLLMALAWVRLRAPDIALAEAALGAGITGTLFLSALVSLEPPTTDKTPAVLPTLKTDTLKQQDAKEPAALSKGLLGLATLLLTAAGLVLTLVIWELPREQAPLSALVSARVAESGVANPVTAVLINFRAYDTLLEMAVLMLALLGSWVLQPMSLSPRIKSSPFLATLLAFSLPLLVISAVYLLWRGADHPGGAFQAGSILAGAVVLLLLADHWRQIDLYRWYWRVSIVMGLVVFISLSLYLIPQGGYLLRYTIPAVQIFVLELAAMFSIALTLAALLQFGRRTDPITSAPVTQGSTTQGQGIHAQ